MNAINVSNNRETNKDTNSSTLNVWGKNIRTVRMPQSCLVHHVEVAIESNLELHGFQNMFNYVNIITCWNLIIHYPMTAHNMNAIQRNIPSDIDNF